VAVADTDLVGGKAGVAVLLLSKSGFVILLPTKTSGFWLVRDSSFFFFGLKRNLDIVAN
jgi:hypothetical protein